MQQRPVVARTAFALNRHILLLAVAVVIFIVLAVIDLGDATFKYSASLAWAGFACFAGSFL